MKHLTRSTPVSDDYACRVVLRHFRRQFPGKMIKIFKDIRIHQNCRAITIYGVRSYEFKSVSDSARALLQSLPVCDRTKLHFYARFESYKDTKKWHPEYLGLPLPKK